MFPASYYLGARKTLLLGGALQTISMFAFAIVGTVGSHGSVSTGKCLIAFSCIYGYAFNFSWGPLAWSVTTEIPSSSLRSRTQSLATIISWGFNLVITAWLPYLINSGAKNYIGSGVRTRSFPRSSICYIVLILVRLRSDIYLVEWE
jgi:SP family sugar:H+ symporter-like MFS transporter